MVILPSSLEARGLYSSNNGGYDFGITTKNTKNSGAEDKRSDIAFETLDWWNEHKYNYSYNNIFTKTTTSPIYDWNEWKDYFPKKPSQNDFDNDWQQGTGSKPSGKVAAEEETNHELETVEFEKSKTDYSWNRPIPTSTGSVFDGVNRYHVLVGGFFILAVISVVIRCSMVYCPCQKGTRGVLLIRETALIIAQRRNERSDSEQDLLSRAEAPADDPPKYEEISNTNDSVTPQ